MKMKYKSIWYYVWSNVLATNDARAAKAANITRTAHLQLMELDTFAR